MENSPKNARRNYNLASNRFISDLHNLERAKESEQMRALQSAGHSCLTCDNTRVALGNRLLCRAKGNKLVQHYNLCPNHVEIRMLHIVEDIIPRKGEQKSHDCYYTI